jgi:hypothetical protein
MSTLTISTGWTCDYIAPRAGCDVGVHPQGNYTVVLPAITLTKPVSSTVFYYCGQGTASVTVRHAGQAQAEFDDCNEPCYVAGTYSVCADYDETFTFNVPFSATINCYPIGLGLPALGCFTAPGAGHTQMLVLTINVAKYTHQHAWLNKEFTTNCYQCIGTNCDSEDICVGVQQACFSFYCYVNSTTCAGSRTWLPLSFFTALNLNNDCERGLVQPSYPWAPCDSLCGGEGGGIYWSCDPYAYTLGQLLSDPTQCDYFNNVAQYGCLNHTIYRVLTNGALYPLTGCTVLTPCDSTWSGVGVTGYTIYVLTWTGAHGAVTIT